MEEIFPKQPFVKRLEFVGSLHQGNKFAEGLHIVLQYSLIKEGEITGNVLGTGETFKKLSKISELPGQASQCVLRSESIGTREFGATTCYGERS